MSIVPHRTHGPIATRSVSGFLNHSITVSSIDGSDASASVDHVTIRPFFCRGICPPNPTFVDREYRMGSMRKRKESHDGTPVVDTNILFVPSSAEDRPRWGSRV